MITTFLDYQKHNRGLMDSTLCEKSKDIQAFIDFAHFKGSREMTLKTYEVTIQCWVQSMSKDGLSAATIKRRVSTLRSWFGFWKNQGLIDKNPAQYTQTPILRERVTKTVSVELIKEYLNSTPKNEKDLRLQALTALIVTTGVRISEALNMDTSDIDKAHHAIRVRGKGDKERIVYYTSTTADYMNRYARGKKGKIFAGWSQREVRDEMVTAIRTDDRGVHPHLLRHTFASIMVENGATLEEVAKILGHTSTKTTERYVHIANSRTAQTYETAAPRL